MEPKKKSLKAKDVADDGGQDGRYAMLDMSRLPTVVTAGSGHIIGYANAAFCLLVRKKSKEMVGNPIAVLLGGGDECQRILDHAYAGMHPVRHRQRERAEPDPMYWTYEVSSIQATDSRPAGLMIQVTETSRFNQQLTAANEALLVAGMRQHALTEAAETLNGQLEVEIKERKQTLEALLRSEKLAAAGRLSASIAHEINNPLESVMNTLFLARSTPGLPEAAREYLEVADGELRRVAHIARQSLGFYRESTAPVTNSASALLDSVFYLLQAKIKAKGATVQKQCDQRLKVTGVFGELRQVVSNLLANALDAVDENGTVKLRCARCALDGQRRVRITVSDNGKGVDTAARKQIFEPFFTTKGSVGTGLGLWVSKQIIEKHGGSIHVRSNTTGRRRGTTFSVVLPAEG